MTLISFERNTIRPVNLPISGTCKNLENDQHRTTNIILILPNSFLSIDTRRRMIINYLCVPSDTIVSKWRKGVRNDHNLSPHVIGLTAFGWQKVWDDHNLFLHVIRLTASGWQKSQNDHNLSLRAIGHDRIWMAKGVQNDHNLSPHVISLAASGWQKAQNDHNLSLCAIGHDCLQMAKWCAEWP